MEDKTKRLIVISILAYGIGTFLFAIGILTRTFIGTVLFYIIAIALIVCGILALFNNYRKNEKFKIYIYLIIVGIFFFVLNTVVFINTI